MTRWEHTYAFRPGRWSQKDYNFETPSTDLTTTEKTVLKLRNADAFERFDYPGLYTDKSLGTKLTRTLMEAEEAAYHAVLGASNYPCLDTGGKFTLGEPSLREGEHGLRDSAGAPRGDQHELPGPGQRAVTLRQHVSRRSPTTCSSARCA